MPVEFHHRHWNLRRAPFQPGDVSGTCFRGTSSAGALVKLRYLLDHAPTLGAVVGASGVGKTYLVNSLRHAGELDGPFVPLVFPQLPPLDLLVYLLDRLGGSTSDATSLGRALICLETRLEELTRAGQTPCLVIDDAHLIDERRTFETLQQLLNLQSPRERSFVLLLVGQPELLATLARSQQLADRLDLTVTLTPFSAEESADYIRHRLGEAGAMTEIFTTDALEAVFELTGGVGRSINRLCDLAMLLACAEDESRVSADHVASVAAEVGQRWAA